MGTRLADTSRSSTLKAHCFRSARSVYSHSAKINRLHLRHHLSRISPGATILRLQVERLRPNHQRATAEKPAAQLTVTKVLHLLEILARTVPPAHLAKKTGGKWTSVKSLTSAAFCSQTALTAVRIALTVPTWL